MQTLVQVVVDGDGDGQALATHSVVGEVEGEEKGLEGGDGGDGRQAKAGAVADAHGVAHPLRDGVWHSVGNIQLATCPANTHFSLRICHLPCKHTHLTEDMSLALQTHTHLTEDMPFALQTHTHLTEDIPLALQTHTPHRGYATCPAHTHLIEDMPLALHTHRHTLHWGICHLSCKHTVSNILPRRTHALHSHSAHEGTMPQDKCNSHFANKYT